MFVASYMAVAAYFWSIQDYKIFMPLKTIERTPAVRFEAVEIPTSQSAVHGFWLPETDEAPVALYLHGQDANIGKNLDHAECLHQLGCNVLVIDYRGFGETHGTVTPSESSVYHDADAAWDYLTTTRGFAPERILIYGHSLGGAIAIELATRHPDAGGLVAESTFTSLKNMARWKEPVTHVLPLDLLLRHRFESLEKVREKKLPPVLFIHGTADTKVPCSMCEQLYAAASGTNKDMLLIKDGQHASHEVTGQSKYREKVAAFISQYFGP